MLGWILLGVLLAVAAITIIVEHLDENTAAEQLKANNIKTATIREIIEKDGIAHIKLDGLTDDDEDVQIEFEASSYDEDEIQEGTVIIAEE